MNEAMLTHVLKPFFFLRLGRMENIQGIHPHNRIILYSQLETFDTANVTLSVTN